MKKMLLAIFLMISLFVFSASKIYLWHIFEEPLRSTLTQLINEFNSSNKDIEIVLHYMGDYENLLSKLKSTIAFRNQLPHLFLGYSSWMSQIPNGMLENCGDLIDSELLENIHPQLLNDAKFQNKQLGLPFNKSIILMYVNEQMMEKLNISAKDIRTDNMLNVLKEIKQKSGKPAMSYNGSVWFFQNLLLNNGGNIRNLNNKQSASTLDIIRELYNSNSMIIRTGFSFQDDWIKGDVPLIFSSIASINFMKDNIKFKYSRYGFLPDKDGHRRSLLAGGNIYALKSDQKKEVSTFLNWFFSENINKKWVERSGYLSIYKDNEFLKNTELVLEPYDDRAYRNRRRLSTVIKNAIVSKESSERLLRTVK